MTAIFDTLDYVEEAVKSGYTEQQAKFQARRLATLVDEQLVTKSFLSGELRSLEITMIKWMIGISFAQLGLLIGIIGFIVRMIPHTGTT